MACIENEYLKLEAVTHGAELIQVYDKEKQIQRIWSADPKYWNRHAPNLFPFVGKVCGGTYSYQGKTYTMGQHGFARDTDFQFVGQDQEEMTYRLTDSQTTRDIYPFAFTLDVTYRLQGRKVLVQWQVTNPSQTEDMYFSIGGHPAFQLLPDTTRTDYLLDFHGKEYLEYVLIDSETESVDNEHPVSIGLMDGLLPLTADLFDEDALIFDEEQISKVSLCTTQGTPVVTVECQGFPSFGIWSKPDPDTPFICLEPWIGRCDNKGFAGDLSEKYGITKLTPGKSFFAEYRMEFH